MKSGWWTRRSIGLHAALLVAVPSFLVLGFWQLDRALGGNTLSWVYTIEWPFFAAYACYMWWKLVHEEVAGGGRRGGVVAEGVARPAQAAGVPADEPHTVPPAVPETRAPVGFDPYDESDPELAAYNRYLASLHAERPKE